MSGRDIGDLILLAAIWGASFLFMRVASPAFGPLPLVEMRVGIAALVLLPLLASRVGLGALFSHWRPLLFVGVTNSALPFVLYGWALLSVSAGFASVTNATSPLWAALIAFVWLGQRLTPAAIGGLCIGFVGVLVLAWDKISFHGGNASWAVLACLTATLSYGIAANYTKHRLAGVAPLAVATGSQFYAALVLLPGALWFWPERMPDARAWGAVLALAVVCTGLAYFLYFRLIDRLGPARAISVTFLIPLFGMLWGQWFLDEQISPAMLAACAAILFGTALASGVLQPGRLRRA